MINPIYKADLPNGVLVLTESIIGSNSKFHVIYKLKNHDSYEFKKIFFDLPEAEIEYFYNIYHLSQEYFFRRIINK